jgi:hypothetical protein
VTYSPDRLKSNPYTPPAARAYAAVAVVFALFTFGLSGADHFLYRAPQYGARWVFIVLFWLVIGAMALQWERTLALFREPTAAWVPTAVQLLLYAIAVVLLSTPASAAWYKRTP